MNDIDLTSCDREPIHIPNRIQSHGFLLVCETLELQIIQLSKNTENFIGISFNQLLNSNLSNILSSNHIEDIKEWIRKNDFSLSNPTKIIINNNQFNMISSFFNNLLILEFEPIFNSDNNIYSKFYYSVNTSLNKIQSTANLSELFETTAQQIKQLLGYDRVMIYRFDKDWNGEVVGESKENHLEPYYGLHYPHTDIPTQARALYLINWIRLITDVNEPQPEIFPIINSVTNQPIDLSYSILRATSPVHIEYLKNMGVCATLTISIIFQDKLWGLFSCHHYSPKFIDYHMRTTCELIGKIFSSHLAFKEADEDKNYSNTINNNIDKLIEQMSKKQDLVMGLIECDKTLLDINNSTGAAIFYDDNLTLIGNTPPSEETNNLINWLNSNVDDLYTTNNLSSDFSEAINYKDKVSGLIYTSLSKLSGECIVWFRPEERQTVNWGGNPNEKNIVVEDSNIRLSPRKSFDKWTQNVEGKSLPWKSSELKAVSRLKENIIKVVMYNSIQLRALNKKINDKNNELQSFAHIASHDLKEPIRTIMSYNQLLKRKYQSELDETANQFLNFSIDGAKRIGDMVDNLLDYAKTGLDKNSFKLNDLNEIIKDVLYNLKISIDEKSAIIKYNNLPEIVLEKNLISQLFQNLISNAIKYNKNNPVIKIDYEDRPDHWLFCVSDNGIGIEPEYFETIFNMFRRLHSKTEYEGTGIGLSTCKKIVELHHGDIWVESRYGEGSVFSFTISKNL